MKINKRIGLWAIILIGASSINCKQVESASTSEGGIEFESGAFTEALQKAGDDQKLIFLDAYAAWCGPCRYMSKKVFTDTTVGSYFNENFVNLKIDMEKGEGPQLARKYRVNAYPSLFILNKNGEVVAKHIGAMDQKKLIAFGQKAQASTN